MTNPTNAKKIGTLEFETQEEMIKAEDFFMKQDYYIEWSIFSSQKRYILTVYKVLDE